MVPHKKFHLVLMSFKMYFGTRHLYNLVANQVFRKKFTNFLKFYFFTKISGHYFHPYPTMLPAMFTRIFGHFFRVLGADMVFTPKWQFFWFLFFLIFLFRPDSLLPLFVSEGGQGPRGSSGALHSVTTITPME